METRRSRRAKRFFALLANDRKAATAVEYGLILALIVLALIVALIALGTQNRAMWGDVNDKVKAATPN